MPKKITFYASDDGLSGKLIKILDGLIGKVKDVAKSSSRDVWPAFGVTSVKITLSSTLGRREELEFEIWVSPNNYQEAMKARYGLTSLPAVKIGDNVFVGENAVSIASDLHALLTTSKYTSAEQIFYLLATTAESFTEMRAQKTSREELILKEDPVTKVFRQTISEKLSSLEKLYNEKKIDEETYRKMKKTYEELLEST